MEFIEIHRDLHQLKMSGVHEGEKLIVLTQGRDRLDYADAFMAAGQRLGARMYHMRLPAPPPSGGWNVGVTGLAALPDAVASVEELRYVDRLRFPVVLARTVRHPSRGHTYPVTAVAAGTAGTHDAISGIA